MNQAKRQFILVWILGVGYFSITILPYLIFGFELHLGVTSYPDIIDLFFYPPIIGLTLFALFKGLKTNEIPTWIQYLAYFLLILHFEGHGFHWAANSLDVLMEHEGISGLLANYAYFLDEIVSHKIMYYTFYGYAILLVLLESKYSDYTLEEKWYLILPAAILGGFAFMISGIEGQSPYEVITAAIIIIAITCYIFRNKFREITKKPIICFYFIASIVMLITAGLYLAIFGSFIQPSEWF